MNPPVDVPRAVPVSAHGAERLLFTWLSRPRLERATLISFGLEPALEWSGEIGEGTRVLSTVERAALDCPVTLVTSTEVGAAYGRRGDRLREWFRRLDGAGATILMHDTLHAKVYLFEEADRRCWLVGSTNLTYGGFGNNEEVSLRGYHPEDYAQVAAMAQRIIGDSYPYSGRF